MAGPMTHVNYNSDDGNVYRLKEDASNAAAANNPAATSTLFKPAGLEPRYILATHPTTGRERKIVISDAANAMFVGGVSAITLTDFTTTPSAQVTYQIFSRVGERRYNRG